jgi:hypothetical protein
MGIALGGRTVATSFVLVAVAGAWENEGLKIETYQTGRDMMNNMTAPARIRGGTKNH